MTWVLVYGAVSAVFAAGVVYEAERDEARLSVVPIPVLGVATFLLWPIFLLLGLLGFPGGGDDDGFA